MKSVFYAIYKTFYCSESGLRKCSLKSASGKARITDQYESRSITFVVELKYEI
jgi:hypothetical protein